MTVGQFAALVKAELPYAPNPQQDALIGALARFCAGTRRSSDTPAARADADRAFIVNGYAGTGKTTVLAALVRALRSVKIDVVLMAPTGRAAKVFSAYAGTDASTIHRRIYRHSIAGETPGLRENRSHDTIFIVDEASMIGDAAASPGGNHDLLADLLTYVYGGDNSRLILVGDTAQLPPVGDSHSPAMDADTLRAMGIHVSRATLTSVARQHSRSGILANATLIRRTMAADPTEIPKPLIEPFDDVAAVTNEDLFETIDSAYRNAGIDDTIIITRSNRRAADFNRAIRGEVLYLEEELTRDEPLLIVKNNYFWTRGRKDIDFVANGDILRVVRILGTEAKWGFRFADVELAPFVPETDEVTTAPLSGTGDSASDAEKPAPEPLQAKIFLETLGSEHPALPRERLQELYNILLTRVYPDAVNPIQALAKDPYWNALQAKYAYCVTCHKAQGGQWSDVIVDIAHINPDTVGPDLCRWMYTATTRARHRLTYITDPPQY